MVILKIIQLNYYYRGINNLNTYEFKIMDPVNPRNL